MSKADKGQTCAYARMAVPILSTTDYNYNDDDLYASSGYKKPTVNWYPGHIAKAERQLKETLRAVDVVVEVRDARIPKATSHPKVGEWCAGRPRIVVLTHVDCIPKASQKTWADSYRTLGPTKWDDELYAQVANQAMQAISEQNKYTPSPSTTSGSKEETTQKVVQVLFVNAKLGQGISALTRAIFTCGKYVQERRRQRGLKERPLRVGMMGYPNVGKSALINRLLGIRRAKTANTPGVTLSLQWIRVKQQLDSPGIIPAFLENQEDAALLAACNCIGDKAYDNQAIAAFFMEWVKALHVMNQQQVTCPQFRQTCKERYGLDPLLQPNLQPNQENGLYMTGQDILCQVADNKCRGDLEDASRKILQDFRKGRLGPICLQLAPSLASETDGDGQEQSVLPLQHSHHHAKSKRRQFEEQLELEERTRKERAVTALKTAKQQGLELPPSMVDETSTDKDNKDVGKGLFDGW